MGWYNQNMYKVSLLLLAGGFGRKLWPLARRDFPKPFLKIINDKSLLRLTVERFKGYFALDNIYLITEDKYRFLINDELRGTGVNRIIFEPATKGTLYSILFALKYLEQNGELPEALVIAPTDQVVDSPGKFFETLDLAIRALENRDVVLLGVAPEYPAEEFGYIKMGESIGNGVYEVERFIEKPERTLAVKLVKENNWLWNMGVFIIDPKKFLDNLKDREIFSEIVDFSLEELTRIYNGLEPRSFTADFLESAEKLAVTKAMFKWSSLSNWLAIYRWLSNNGENVIKGNVTADNVKTSMILGDSRKIVALSIEDLVLVETRDAVFISRLSESVRLKDVVEMLLTKGEQEFVEHKTIFRPWGSYTILDDENGFKVKRLTIKPGGVLSLQYHNKRSEHWIVVRGKVKTEIDGREAILTKGESTFVPVGKIHRLSNPFEELAEIVEVQVGDYLGEDDIVRVKDIYGRSPQ